MLRAPQVPTLDETQIPTLDKTQIPALDKTQIPALDKTQIVHFLAPESFVRYLLVFLLDILLF